MLSLCIKKYNLMFSNFNFQEFISAVYRIIAVIDIIGSIPIIINLKDRGTESKRKTKATVISFMLLIGFSMPEICLLKLSPCRH